MRLFLPPLLLLASCSEGSSEGGEPLPESSERVECAVSGASSFQPACTVERTLGPNGLTLTIRNASGGFRRLLVTRDGRGVVSADGAQEALVTPIAGNRIEVRIAGDRYRLPATVKK